MQIPSCHRKAVDIVAGTCESVKHPLSVWLDSAPASLTSGIKVKKENKKETQLLLGVKLTSPRRCFRPLILRDMPRPTVKSGRASPCTSQRFRKQSTTIHTECPFTQTTLTSTWKHNIPQYLPKYFTRVASYGHFRHNKPWKDILPAYDQTLCICSSA
jgi:hypothetical protein